MIPLDRYPKEITLRDDARAVLRPMRSGDADGLWNFLRQLPEIDKSHFHEDVDRREVVERWATSLDYDAALPILAIHGERVVGSATLFRNMTGWKQRIGIVTDPDRPRPSAPGPRDGDDPGDPSPGREGRFELPPGGGDRGAAGRRTCARTDGVRESGGLSEFRQRPERRSPQSRGAPSPHVGSEEIKGNESVEGPCRKTAGGPAWKGRRRADRGESYSAYLWNTKPDSFAPLRWHSKQSLTGSIFNGFPAGSYAWKIQPPVASAFRSLIMTSVFAFGPGA